MNHYPGNIVLIGFHSSGKTHVGKMLAKYLNREFFDLKDDIEKRNACSLHALSLIHNDNHIHKLERALIEELQFKDRLVIASTYFTVKDVRNVLKLKQNSLLIHLNASKYSIFRNLLHDNPNNGSTEQDEFYEDVITDISNQLNDNQKFYACCDFAISIDELTGDEIVDEIISYYSIYKKIYKLDDGKTE